MAVIEEQVAHADLVGGEQTALHKHNGANLVVAETEVFNGTSPTSWTDLNLSGVIGSNAALVILKVFCVSARVVFRKNGDTDEFSTLTQDARGCALAKGSGVAHLVMLVATDANGVVEWTTLAAEAATIDIIAYIK